jgi:hypothetical protein
VALVASQTLHQRWLFLESEPNKNNPIFWQWFLNSSAEKVKYISIFPYFEKTARNGMYRYCFCYSSIFISHELKQEVLRRMKHLSIVIRVANEHPIARKVQVTKWIQLYFFLS